MAHRERIVYDFKSVGESVEQEIAAATALIPSPLPVGIKTPMELGINSGLFRMHTKLVDQVRDNLKNLVMTNHGERLGHFDFGANLLPLVFELGSADFDSEAIRRIKLAAAKYMPYVNLKTFSPLVDRLDNEHVAKVGVRVVYTVPKLSNAEYALEVVLYAGG